MKALFDTLPRWRRPVLGLLAVVTVALTSQIMELEAVFAPEDLIPPEETSRAHAALDAFSELEQPIVLVIEARERDGGPAASVLTQSTLSYTHALARSVETLPWVQRVEGLTTTPLPHAPPPDDTVTLDDPFEDEGTEPSPEAAALEEAVGRVVATDPVRFPMGLASVRSSFVLGPLVRGEEVTEEARRTIVETVDATPMLTRRLIDEARRVTVLVLVPRHHLSADEEEAAVRDVRERLAERAPPSNIRVTLAGLPAVRVAMVEALRRDQILLVSLAIAGSFVVLLIGFRSWAGALLPLAAAGMTSGMVVGAMAWVGEPLNILNNVVPPLLITVGLGDSVHLLVRYREELGRDPDRMQAAQRTMRTMLAACFLTSVTTAIGFGSLVMSETEVLRRFGVTAALGVMLAYVVTVFFIPAALPDFRVSASVARRHAGRLEAVIGWLARLSIRRSAAVVVVAIIGLVASLAYGSQVRVDSALLDQLEEGSPTRRTAQLLEARLDGVRVLTVGLEGDEGHFARAEGLRQVGALETWLGAQPEVLRVGSHAELPRDLWRRIAGPDAGDALDDPERAVALASLAQVASPAVWSRHVDPSGRYARLEVRVRDAGERSLNGLIDRLESRLDEAGVRGSAGGEVHRSARGLGRLVDDLLSSLALAVVVIFTVLGLMLRSVRLGLISILPNVLPLAITLAYMVARDIALHAATVIVFTVSIGLAVDGTIHVLARYREEVLASRRRIRAVLATMRGSGRAVVLGAMTLLPGFGALLFGSFVPIRLFAELSIVAIVTALIAELTVVPALLSLFGPAPARPSTP